MATLLQDTFAGINGTDLTLHTMDVGSGWSNAAGSIQIQSNAASGAAGVSGAISTYTANAGQADVVVTLDVPVPVVGTNFGAGITVRGTSLSDIWLMALEEDGSGPYIAIVERTAGVQTNRQQSAGIIGIAGTTVTLTATLNASTIGLSVPGTSISYGSAATRVTDTHHGIWVFFTGGYTPVSVDNFLVTGAGGAAPIGTSLQRNQAVNRAGTY